MHRGICAAYESYQHMKAPSTLPSRSPSCNPDGPTWWRCPRGPAHLWDTETSIGAAIPAEGKTDDAGTARGGPIAFGVELGGAEDPVVTWPAFAALALGVKVHDKDAARHAELQWRHTSTEDGPIELTRECEASLVSLGVAVVAIIRGIWGAAFRLRGLRLVRRQSLVCPLNSLLRLFRLLLAGLAGLAGLAFAWRWRRLIVAARLEQREQMRRAAHSNACTTPNPS